MSVLDIFIFEKLLYIQSDLLCNTSKVYIYSDLSVFRTSIMLMFLDEMSVWEKMLIFL